MLLEFTVGNFKSFREKATLSLEATSDDTLEESNLGTLDSGVRLVKGAGIYGANAGGKSNLSWLSNKLFPKIPDQSQELCAGRPRQKL